MLVSIRLDDDVVNSIRELAKEQNKTNSEIIRGLLSSEAVEELTVQRELTYDLEIDELPSCCQRIYQDEVPRKCNLCSHWKLAYQNRWGARVLNYQHSITGRFCDDPIYIENYA